MLCQGIRHTSPAPRNKNLWSAKFPPTNFKAATSPARTTDAVPWNKVDKVSETVMIRVHKLTKFMKSIFKIAIYYLNIVVENQMC